MTSSLDAGAEPAATLRDELGRCHARANNQRDALVRLTDHQMADCASFPETLRSILEVSAATLGVSRASIWRYNDTRFALECVDLYESATNRHSVAPALNADDYPDYFSALARAGVLAADDAVSDPRTREFTDGYLRPLGIQSMIDAPLYFGGALDGVLCHEHCGDTRHWTADEKAFVIAVSNQISLIFERCQRHRIEAALALQSAALDAAADAMVITDREGGLVWANPAFTQLTGYTVPEALGKNPRELVKSGVHDSSFYQNMWTTLLDGRVWRGELTNRRKDGVLYVEDQTITPVTDATGAITHFVSIKRDLSAQRTLEAQLLQAQKMEVVGRLSGGIAHDFNNLLTVINGTAELALMDLAPDHPVRADFERIKESGMRASSLTRQLLAFSRKQITRRETVDLSQLLTNFRGMLQRLIGEDITLIVNADALLATVSADPSQIEQVVLNLAVNARDAMPLGGRLTIEVRNVALDQAFADTHTGVNPGRHVLLEVTDTGTGMSAETLSLLFEPFFTTKEDGKGTGLGLATVYGVVQQSGGTIWVESALGRGTTFSIYLPATSAPQMATAKELTPAAGHGTVLLVEDEDAVRDLATRILRAAGYTVLAASNAAMALERLRTGGADVELIVTDVVLPGMGGREMAEQALKLRPGIPVLYTSGYTDDTVLAYGVAQNTVHFIAKPFTVSALTNKIREVVRRAPASGGMQ